MSSDNNNNFILSANPTDTPDNSVDINSVEVIGGELVDSDTKDEVTSTLISINDKGGLNNLSTLVNDGFDFSNYTVILTDNISFTSTPQQSFIPIGNANNKFKGTFDGQGHTISKLTIKVSATGSEDIYAGLFGYLDTTAKIKNVGLINSDISATATSMAYAGGITGYNSGTISNCYNTGNVSNSNVTGGIAGNNTGTISNCYNTGAVTGSSYAGGIAGTNIGTISNCYNTGAVKTTAKYGYAGGIAGWNSKGGTIQNCYNTGKVTSSNNAGGIAGTNIGTISNCYNTGNISGTSGDAGGIAGWNSEGGTIQNCYNTGKVTSSDKAGGIAGTNNGTISNCYNVGDVTVPNGDAGGIVASSTGSITNSFYRNGCVSNGKKFGTELTSENMKGVKLLGEGGNNLNVDPNSKPWSPDIFNANNGYPVLADVPLEINKPSETPVPPKSSVYLAKSDETPQVANYLDVIRKTNGESVNVSVKYSTDTTGKTFMYQWYTMNNDGTSTKLESKTSDNCDLVHGTYFVKITSDDYSYTSLTRTVFNTVTVTFNSNGGSKIVPSTITMEYDTTLTAPDDPTRTGCTFAGWCSDEELKNEWDFGTSVTKNITLYAKWTATVTFIGKNVTISEFGESQTVTADTEQSYTLIKAEGYCLPDRIEVKMGGSTLTAGTDYTYNSKTGQLILKDVSGNVIITTDGVKVSEVTINIKLDSDLYTNYSGKVFLVGADNKYELKSNDGTCEGTIDSGTYTVKVGEDEDSAEVYSAEWDSSFITLDILFWTVTFNYNYDGSTNDTKAVLNESTLTSLADPTRSNYKFEGWYKEAECTNKWDLNTPVIEEGITLYAKWRYIPPEQIYSLCLHSNDSDNLTKRYSGTYATKITLPSVESINWNNNVNCTFIEWNSKADGSGESFKAGDKFSLGSEIWNLYAVWSDSSVHNVTFNSNGGSNVSSQKVTDGYRASQSETPIKEGHAFKYWSLNGSKYDFNKSVREDITLKAEYEVNQYKVSFYYKGELLTTKTADFNTSLEDRMPSLPSGTNEWNSDENGKGDKFTSDSLVTKDSSVYAVSSSHSFNSALIIGGIAAIALLALLAAWLYFVRSKNQ